MMWLLWSHKVDSPSLWYLVTSCQSWFAGKGVFAKKDYKKGEFILEYDGELISRREGENREKNYSSGLGSYIFFFKSPQGGKKLW